MRKSDRNAVSVALTARNRMAGSAHVSVHVYTVTKACQTRSRHDQCMGKFPDKCGYSTSCALTVPKESHQLTGTGYA